MEAGDWSCNDCGSTNVDKFSAEIDMRRYGLENINLLPVFVFADVLVCLNCGVSKFRITEFELRALAKRNAAAGG